jgi:hypothetical protein
VLADLGTVLAVGAIPLSHASTGLSFPALAVLAFGIGLGRAPARRAKQVLLPQAIDEAGTSAERGTSAQEGVHTLLAGVLLDTVGLRPAVLVLGGLCLLATTCPLVFPVWREMDQRPQSALKRTTAKASIISS